MSEGGQSRRHQPRGRNSWASAGRAPVAFLQVICSAKNGVVAGDGDYDDDPESGFGLLDTVPDRLSTAPSHYKSPRTII